MITAAEAKRREDWNRTADLLALLATVHRDSNAHPAAYVRSDFHPMATDEERAAPRPGVERIRVGDLAKQLPKR